MTLIIGIVCKDGIVIAGDSQTTWQTGKSWEANKMTDLAHPGGHAIIAESGATITSSNILEELQKLVRDKNCLEKYSLPELAQKAVRKVRDSLRFQNFECSSEELQNIIGRNELQAVLMFAHYEGDAPRIDTVDLVTGISQRAKKMFETVGSGSDLAHYLLSNLFQARNELVSIGIREKQRPATEYEIDTEEAVMIAVYVVEIVKRYDPYCGGPSKLGIVRHPNYIKDGRHLVIKDLSGNVLRDDALPVFIPCQLEIDKIVRTVSEVDAVTKAEFWVKITNALKQQIEKRTKELREVTKALKREMANKAKKTN